MAAKTFALQPPRARYAGLPERPRTPRNSSAPPLEAGYLPPDRPQCAKRARTGLGGTAARSDAEGGHQVILNLSYTAREGGGLLGKAAKEAAQASGPREAVRLFSLRNELSAPWASLENELDAATGDQILELSFGGKLPYLSGVGDARITGVALAGLWRHTTARLEVKVIAPSGQSLATEADEVIVPSPEAPAELTLNGPEASDGIWTIRIPQSVIAGPALEPDLTEDWPTDPSFKRIKPSELLDILAIVTIERDAKLIS